MPYIFRVETSIFYILIIVSQVERTHLAASVQVMALNLL